MRCPRCKADNREGRRFGAECGAGLSLACPSCAFANDPGERFCGGGAALAPGAPSTPPRFASPRPTPPTHLAEKILTSKAALEGERKQVTVLFADLTGSMELLADRDPGQARTLLDPVLAHMMEAVHRGPSACARCRRSCGGGPGSVGQLMVARGAMPSSLVTSANHWMTSL